VVIVVELVAIITIVLAEEMFAGHIIGGIDIGMLVHK
jgi:hypothetical protein